MQDKSLAQIGSIIARDWDNPYFGALPYIRALRTLDTIDDDYGYDSGKSIVLYFLSNARSWRGDVAREVKKELNRRAK